MSTNGYTIRHYPGGKISIFDRSYGLGGNCIMLSEDNALALGRDLVERLSPVAPKVPAQTVVAPKARPHGAQEYRGNGKHKWELVTSNQDAARVTGSMTTRLRVPGGWLYQTGSIVGGKLTGAPTSVFVPVPDAVGYAV